MPVFTPENLAEWTGGFWHGSLNGSASGFGMDTRILKPGSVFIALRTAARDGHDYLESAKQAGAVAAITERVIPGVNLPQLVTNGSLKAFQAIAREHRRKFSHPVVGVTGSAGKTSTKQLLAKLLGGEEGGVLATEGNLNNHIGVPLTLTRLEPDRHKFAVIEAGISEPGEMDVLADMIRPDIAVVTLVAPAHLLALGSLEGVAHEKSRLAAIVAEKGRAVFPAACLAYPEFRDLNVRVSSVATAGEIAPMTAIRYRTESKGDRMLLHVITPLGEAHVCEMRAASPGMAGNAALALATAQALGVEWTDLAARIRDWQPASMRGEWIQRGATLYYLDCYNANPAAMTDAFQLFADRTDPQKPRVYVIGGMEELGAASANYHRDVGTHLKLRAQDRAFLLATEATSLRAGLIAAGGQTTQIAIINDAAELAPALQDFDGSVFVKGSRKYQLERLIGDASAH